jgi:hypothetical protein
LLVERLFDTLNGGRQLAGAAAGPDKQVGVVTLQHAPRVSEE